MYIVEKSIDKEEIMMQLKEISIEIIRKCPNNCVHCSSCSSINQSEIIPYEKFCEVIKDAAKLGLKTLCFSGGEPLLHPDFCRMIDYVNSFGIDIYIYTSGIYYDNEKYLSISNDLLIHIKNKVKKIIFNVEASNDSTYDKIMGTQGNFSLLKHSIINAVKSGITCEAHFVPMKYNYNEIENTIELCQKLGIDKISFLRLVPHGRAEQNQDDILLNSEETKKLKQKLQDLFNNTSEIGIRIGTPLARAECRHNCEAAKGKLNIKYDGKVYPCEVFKNDRIKCVNGLEPDCIFEKRLIDIYKESEYLQMIRKYVETFSHQYVEENCIGQHYINNR